MKELFLALLFAFPNIAKAADGNVGQSSSATVSMTITIAERIIIKENPKTKKVELEKSTNIPVEKIETKDAKGNKVIVYVPKL